REHLTRARGLTTTPFEQELLDRRLAACMIITESRVAGIDIAPIPQGICPNCEARSQSRVYRLALQGENAEDALVDPAQRLASHKSLQSLDAERELAKGERPLAAETAAAKTSKIRLGRVIGTVDDA